LRKGPSLPGLHVVRSFEASSTIPPASHRKRAKRGVLPQMGQKELRDPSGFGSLGQSRLWIEFETEQAVEWEY